MKNLYFTIKKDRIDVDLHELNIFQRLWLAIHLILGKPLKIKGNLKI